MEKQWSSRRNPRETLFKFGLLKKAMGKVVQRVLCPGPAAILACPYPLPGSCCSHGGCVCVNVHGLSWDWAAVISKNAQELLESSWKASASILPAVVWWVPVCITTVKCIRGNLRQVCASFYAVLLEEISMPVLPIAVCSIPRLVARLGCGLWVAASGCGKGLGGPVPLPAEMGYAFLSHVQSQWCQCILLLFGFPTGCWVCGTIIWARGVQGFWKCQSCTAQACWGCIFLSAEQAGS